MASPSRPDPAQGLFETLLVLAGAPVELDAHLDRMSASLETLFGLAPPPALAERARERAQGTSLGRLRIAVTPEAAALRTELAIEAVDPADFFPGRERRARLRSLPYAGGLGAHKWADRTPLGAGDGAVPLLLDRGGEVLEAGRANVFAVVDESLLTPSADGRILPGTARAAAIEVARAEGIGVREGRLELEELLGADEAFLTGSVRGVEPVRTLDGASLPAAGELSRLVGDRLRRRWLGAPIGSAPPASAGAPPAGPLSR
jgi:para-aminobenzoate synthetase/4-amino-4-deoxychorismate lyase